MEVGVSLRLSLWLWREGASSHPPLFGMPVVFVYLHLYHVCSPSPFPFMSQSLAKMGVGLADGDEVAGGGSAGASAGSGEGEGESTLSLGSLTVSRDSTFVCPTCACVCRCLRGLSSCTVSLRPDRPSIFRFLLPPVVPQGALVELEEEEDKFEALERWLTENGAVFPLLYMKRYSENYRGVHIRTTTGVRGLDTGQVHPVAGTLLSPFPPRALWRCAHVCSCLFAPPPCSSHMGCYRRTRSSCPSLSGA